MKKILIVAFFAVASMVANAQKSPKNVIIMIGDGMGYNTVSLRVLDAKGHSNFERFNHIGSSKTYCLEEKITDSAAGGTAIATGQKTYSGAIGVDADKKPLKNILEIARSNKQKTGVVVTCGLTHATPASFLSHQPSRKLTENIAKDIVASGCDYLVGGDFLAFTKRKDGANLLDSAKAHGYEIFRDTASYFSASPAKAIVVVADEHPKSAVEGRGNYLSRAVEKTIENLQKNKQGFVMMVEGSQIDWAAHNNKTAELRAEMVDFDAAIGKALDFAQKDKNTLVIVLADHDTGGVSLPPVGVNELSDEYGDYAVKYSTGAHAGTMIPVFAYGPGAEAFGGIYENTEVFNKLMKLKGWKR